MWLWFTIFISIVVQYAQFSSAMTSSGYFTVTNYAGSTPGTTTLPANATSFSMSGVTPNALYVDSTGQLFFSSNSDNRVYKIDTGGVMSLFAGTSSSGFGTATVAAQTQATACALNAPSGVCGDTTGRIYIVDTLNNRLLYVMGNGVILTAASDLAKPSLCRAGLNGTILFKLAEGSVNKYSRVNGSVTAIAGWTTYQTRIGGDGGPAYDSSVLIADFTGIWMDTEGNLFISTYSTIREVSSGIINRYAGQYGLQGIVNSDNALCGEFYTPEGIWGDTNGNLFIADQASNQRGFIRYIDGRIRNLTTIGGSQTVNTFVEGAATSTYISNPIDLYGFVQTDGTLVLYYIEQITGAARIRKAVLINVSNVLFRDSLLLFYHQCLLLGC